jgi:topoisomerase IA-like protein
MKRTWIALAAALGAANALAAPKIASVSLTPNPARFAGSQAPEVEVAVAVSRGKFDSKGCTARVEFGDGQGRALDFSVADKRNVHHTYKTNGSYNVIVQGAGGMPCEGMQQAALTVAGAPPARARVASKPTQTKTAAKGKTAKKASAKKKAAKKDDKKTEPK